MREELHQGDELHASCFSLSRLTTKLSGRGNRYNLTPWQTNAVAAVRCSAWFGRLATQSHQLKTISPILRGFQ